MQDAPRKSRRRRRPARPLSHYLMKPGILAVCLVVLVFTLTIENASSAVAIAARRVDESRNPATLELSQRYRELAGERLRGAWSRPLDWHTEAQETMGWLYTIDYNRGGRAMRGLFGYTWTVRAIEGAPTHTIGWLRLAALDGVSPESFCAPRTCLEHSWASAPMGTGLDAGNVPFLCDRARLSVATGMIASTSDLRARLFVREGIKHSPAYVHDCLRGLPEDDVEALIRETYR